MDVDDCEITDMDYESSQTDPLVTNGHDTTEHWFCFDDATVTPVTRQHIQKHYGQSDCAYMLFYRQKSRKTNAMECANSMNVTWMFSWTEVDFQITPIPYPNGCSMRLPRRIAFWKRKGKDTLERLRDQIICWFPGKSTRKFKINCQSPSIHMIGSKSLTNVDWIWTTMIKSYFPISTVNTPSIDERRSMNFSLDWRSVNCHRICFYIDGLFISRISTVRGAITT